MGLAVRRRGVGAIRSERLESKMEGESMRRTLVLLLIAVSLTALLGLTAGCGGDDETTTTEAATTETTGGGAMADGAAVFASNCAVCHGADGTGGTGPDLTSLTGLTKERVIDQVTNGGASMPPFGDQLSADEIGAVADYVVGDLVGQ